MTPGRVSLTPTDELSVELTVELTPMVPLFPMVLLVSVALVEFTTGTVELIWGMIAWHLSITSIYAYLVIHATMSSRPDGTLMPTDELLEAPDEAFPHWLPEKASMRAASSVQSQ